MQYCTDHSEKSYAEKDFYPKGETMKYVICINEWYEKYSSNVRCYGGRMQLTKDIREAKLVTRKKDAEYRVMTISYRYKQYDFDQETLAKKYGIKEPPKVYIKERN